MTSSRRFDSVVIALLGLLLGGLVSCASPAAARAQEQKPFTGLDNSVNRNLAEEAGVPPRDPYINTEAMGELWNLILLVAGGTCGFIIGRRWDQLFGRTRKIGMGTPKGRT
jgi:hypothetical protein